MASSRTRRSRWRPRTIAGAAVTLVLHSRRARARRGLRRVGGSVPAIPRIPCGTPEGQLVDFWCGDWATDPPTLQAQPQRAFAPLGALRLERISEEQAALLRGKPFGDVTITPNCGSEALHYAGIYEGGQVVACTADNDEALSGVYREEAPGDLRSGSFEISIPVTAHTFVGSLHQTLSGTPDNDWSGRCTGGWCATVVQTPRHLTCHGSRATIVGQVDPFETNVVFGTPRSDVIVGTGEADVIRAEGART